MNFVHTAFAISWQQLITSLAKWLFQFTDRREDWSEVWRLIRLTSFWPAGLPHLEIRRFWFFSKILHHRLQKFSSQTMSLKLFADQKLLTGFSYQVFCLTFFCHSLRNWFFQFLNHLVCFDIWVASKVVQKVPFFSFYTSFLACSCLFRGLFLRQSVNGEENVFCMMANTFSRNQGFNRSQTALPGS